MQELDSFLWLRIASFIATYDDLRSLSLTCHSLWCICKPLKKKFPDYYVRSVGALLLKQQRKLSKLWRLTAFPAPVNISEPSVVFERLNWQFKNNKEKCSDIHFRTMLYRSEKKALLTFRPRGIDCPELQCFEFKLKLNSDLCVDLSEGDQRYPDFWFRNLHESILSFAFDEHGRIREDVLLRWLGNKRKVTCWLWFECQTPPQESVMLTTISHMGHVRKYSVHNGKVFSMIIKPRYVCDVHQWMAPLFICHSEPLYQSDILLK